MRIFRLFLRYAFTLILTVSLLSAPVTSMAADSGGSSVNLEAGVGPIDEEELLEEDETSEDDSTGDLEEENESVESDNKEEEGQQENDKGPQGGDESADGDSDGEESDESDVEVSVPGEEELGEEELGEEEIIAPMTLELPFSLMSDEAVAVVVPKQNNGTAYGTVVAEALAADGTPKAYDTLESALEAAVSGETVVLLKDYVMSTNATVKSGVTLLLPCEGTYKAYEANGYNPDGTDTSTTTGYGKNAAVFVTLTIPTSITLSLSGNMLVNAVTGRPVAGTWDHDINGGYAVVDLRGDIVANSGSKFDVCGVVSGPGTVTANSGSSVGDLYVVRSWRGGTHAYYIVVNAEADKRAYPMNEMDCHNIESTVVVKHGASYGGIVKMYASGSYYYTRFPQIDIYNGLIRLKSGGYAVKTYDKATKQATVSVYGGADIANSTLNIVGIDLSTGMFDYPITRNLAIELNSGTYTVKNSFKFMPGSELRLLDGANVTVTSGNRLIFYEEFDDLVTGNTQYPAGLPPASVTIASGAKLTVASGSTLAGQIKSSASTGVAMVEFAQGAILTATTYEARKLWSNSNAEQPYTTPINHAALLVGGIAGGEDYTPKVGSTYNFSGRWSGGDIPAGDGDSSLSGKITLQGRTDHSGVEVKIASGSSEFTVYTSADGSFALTGIHVGIYSVEASCAAYLKHSNPGVQVSGESTMPTVELWGGDLNGDGLVNSVDLSVLLGGYLKSQNGNINGDSIVNSQDLNILLGNYLK